jgi:hypothetical protein
MPKNVRSYGGWKKRIVPQAHLRWAPADPFERRVMGTATAFGVGCAECGRTREEVRFATEKLCFACYRSRERARSRAAEEDHHTPSKRQRNEQASLLRNYSAIQNALIGLGATVPQRNEILLHVRTTLRGKLEPIWDLIEPDLVKSINIDPVDEEDG